MSNLKYKLLLCVVAVMLFVIPLYATDVVLYSEDFGTATAVPANWAISSGSDWEVGPPEGGTYDPTAAGSDGSVLGYQLTSPGLYGNGITLPKYARTPAIVCTGKVGVKLAFDRWLTVEDFAKDKATVQVSNDNVNWTPVWQNPTSGTSTSLNTIDTAWEAVEYDISAVADNKATVYVRWGLQTNDTVQFGGWNVDNIVVSASGPTAFLTPTMTADVGPAPPGTVWEWITAPVQGSTTAVLADWDNDPSTPNTLGGADPTALPTGATGIWGTLNGANYPTPMDAQYLTSDAFDATGLSGVAVRFDRWLQVADGAYDEASIQVQVDDDPSTTPAWEDVEVASNDTAVALSHDHTFTYPTIDTTDMYDVNFTVDYDLDGLLAGESLTVQVSPSGADASWVTVLTLTSANNTDDAVNNGVVTSPVLQTPLSIDNGTLYVKLVMAAAETGGGTARVVNITVSGQNWAEAWHNPSGVPLVNVGDEDWNQRIVALSGADGAERVRFRFAMGPTGEFPGYGGWSIGNIAIVEASREFRPAGVTVPTALAWDRTGSATVRLKNTGTATWDSSYAAYEVSSLNEEIDDPANPGKLISVPKLEVFEINRWNVGSIDVTGTVAPDATEDFVATIKAPLISSIVYVTPVSVTAPPDAALSKLDFDWAAGNETEAGLAALPDYMGLGVQTGGIVTTRFPDDQPGSAGEWARPWIEELAGAVPFIVQGFPDGTYGPLVVVDRAAIAVYIQRAANVPSSGAVLGSMFRDVPSDHWACSQIQAVATVGIVSGFPDDTYQPGTLVTRDQMCKFVVNGVDYAIEGTVDNDLGVRTLAAIEADGQGAFPFLDVVVVNDPATTADDRNPLAGFIEAAANNDIVQGYPIVPPATKPKFEPAWTITRDQLAVFVWRGFLRGDLVGPSVVALGGPDFTQAIAPSDIVANEAPYSGLASLTGTIQAGDDAIAYVTFDAVRLDGGGPMTVSFALDGVTPTAPISVLVPAVQIAGWVAQITAATEDADTDGQPYKTIAVPINTAALIHGSYEMTVSVDGVALARKPVLKVMGQIMIEVMDDNPVVLSGWEVTGTPSTVTVAGGLMELTGSQAVQFGQTTDNWHDIRLVVKAKKNADVAAADVLNVWWSKDSGATWTLAGPATTGAGLSTSSVSTLTFDLPNGNPTAVPPVAGADDNPNFMVKIGATVADADGKILIDSVELRGT